MKYVVGVAMWGSAWQRTSGTKGKASGVGCVVCEVDLVVCQIQKKLSASQPASRPLSKNLALTLIQQSDSPQ